MIPFYKYINGYLCSASPLYDGYYDNNQFKMIYKDQLWFDLEMRGFSLLSQKSYVPELLSVDLENLTLTFNWTNCKNINHIMHFDEELPSDWREQIKNIIEDLEMSNLYKINLYPWTFYLKDLKIYAMDLYACLPADDTIYKKDVYHILNDKARFKFNDGILDIYETYKYTLEHNVTSWLGKIIHD